MGKRTGTERTSGCTLNMLNLLTPQTPRTGPIRLRQRRKNWEGRCSHDHRGQDHQSSQDSSFMHLICKYFGPIWTCQLCWLWRRPHSQQESQLSFTELLTGPEWEGFWGLWSHSLTHRQDMWNEVGSQPFLPQMANLHYHLLTSHTPINPSSFKTLPLSRTTFLYIVRWILWVLSLEPLNFPSLVPLITNYRN